MTEPSKVRFAAVFAIKPRPLSPRAIRAEEVDRAGDTASGTLEILVPEPHTSLRTNLEPGWVENPVKPSDWQKTVMPLVAVDGEAVPLGRGRAQMSLPPGEHLVEVMDDHHYDSRIVHVSQGKTSQLWIGSFSDERSKTLLMGDQKYAELARGAMFPPSAKVGGVLCLGALLSAIAGILLALIIADQLGYGDRNWPVLLGLPAIGVVAPLHDPLLRYFEKSSYRRMFQQAKDIETEVIGPSVLPGHDVKLVPPGASLPSATAAISLRIQPNWEALHLISFWAHGMHDRRHQILFYSNSDVDWLITPEVSVNGHPLPERWGNLFIPVRPGPNRVQVTLRGFRDPSTGESYEFTSPITERVEVDVPDGSTESIDCEYNPVALVRERLELYPHTEPYWYQVMRRAAAINTPPQDFDTQIAIEAARIPKLAFKTGR